LKTNHLATLRERGEREGRERGALEAVKPFVLRDPTFIGKKFQVAKNFSSSQVIKASTTFQWHWHD
jgi:hypothetical protein